MNLDVNRKFFIKPGYICIPHQESLLHSVVGSGIIVTIYDRKKKIGGMVYFLKPQTQDTDKLSLYQAKPSIYYLLKLFKKRKCQKEDLEAGIYGGAFNPEHNNYDEDLHNHNVQQAEDILQKNGIEIHSSDVGGKRGRKIIFNTFSGEVIVAKVNHIRQGDWYPNVS